MGHEVSAEFIPAASAIRSTPDRQLHAGHDCESRTRAVFEAETLARFALAPNLVAGIVKVSARRLQQPFRLRELRLCDWTLAQSIASSCGHFNPRDFVQRVERVARSAKHDRRQGARKLQLQGDAAQRTALP